MCMTWNIGEMSAWYTTYKQLKNSGWESNSMLIVYERYHIRFRANKSTYIEDWARSPRKYSNAGVIKVVQHCFRKWQFHPCLRLDHIAK